MRTGEQFIEEGTGQRYEVTGQGFVKIGEDYVIAGTTVGTCADLQHMRELGGRIKVKLVTPDTPTGSERANG